MVTIVFDSDINTSVQVGDMAYYCPTLPDGGFDTSAQSDINQIGVITAIKYNWVTGSSSFIKCAGYMTGSSYVFFSKDNAVNISSPTGYFAKAKFVNDSTVKSEMFAATCDVFESSK